MIYNDDGEDVSADTTINYPSECNIQAIVDHAPAYYFSLYDENYKIMEFPVLNISTNLIDAMTELKCDADGNIHYNFSLPSGFYYIKVFTKELYQSCVITQSIQSSLAHI